VEQPESVAMRGGRRSERRRIYVLLAIWAIWAAALIVGYVLSPWW
jgi:hypothetical protein